MATQHLRTAIDKLLEVAGPHSPVNLLIRPFADAHDEVLETFVRVTARKAQPAQLTTVIERVKPRFAETPPRAIYADVERLDNVLTDFEKALPGQNLVILRHDVGVFEEAFDQYLHGPSDERCMAMMPAGRRIRSSLEATTQLLLVMKQQLAIGEPPSC